MNSKTFFLPKVRAKLISSSQSANETTSIAMAGGREPEGQWLKQLLQLNPELELYAADKGLKYFLGNEAFPKLVLGDADSAGKALFQQAECAGCEVLTYPAEKDDTDLQLLLTKLPAGDLIISGIWGGRFDHLYSNVFSLAKALQEKFSCIIMADHNEMMFLLKEGSSLEEAFLQKLPEAVSLLPLTEKTVVSLEGVHWPLKEQALCMLKPYAISNVLEKENKLSCTCHKGMVGLYCCFK